MSEALTVSQLTDRLDQLVKSHFSMVLVEGEVDQVSTPHSGHAYLTLRDSGASLSGVVWRNQWKQMDFKPDPGQRVVCRGRLGVYGPQGRYQLYIHDIQPWGQGERAAQVEAIKARLAAEGLLDPRRKRPLPGFPHFVGVATSLTGAALQDFLRVSRARYPSARILIAGCQVQGEEAPGTLIRAIELLIEDGRSEVIVVTRGGGSKADLWAFMNEQLARFLAESPVPVVSAVGHEVDTSITDLVADVAAATPSVAANLVFPDGPALAQRVDQSTLALSEAVERKVERAREHLGDLRARLRHPRASIVQQRTRCRDLEARSHQAFSHLIARRRERYAGLAARQARGMVTRLDPLRATCSGLSARLEALSPQGVLERGFAVVRGPDGVLTNASSIGAGDLVHVRVAEGGFRAKVEDVEG